MEISFLAQCANEMLLDCIAEEKTRLIGDCWTNDTNLNVALQAMGFNVLSNIAKQGIQADYKPKDQTLIATIYNLVAARPNINHLFSESKRALVHGGMFAAVFLGNQSLLNVRAALAEHNLTNFLSANHLYEIRELGDLAFATGFRCLACDTDIVKIQYANVNDLLEDLRDMLLLNRDVDIKLCPDTLGEINFELIKVAGFIP